MGWEQVITTIFGVAGFMGIFMFLINKRIDELSKRIDRVEEDIRDMKKEINERLSNIEQLLYRVLGVERKT